MLELAALLDAKRLSDSQAGAAILTDWKRRDPRATQPAARSIATMLGRLKDGDVTWWRKRPMALASLAQVLGVSVEELQPSGDAGPRAIHFPEFAELRQILPGQDACVVRHDGASLASFVADLVRGSTHTWLMAEPGAGKSLAVRVLRQRGDSSFDAMSVRRLCDVARAAKDNVPLVVEVDVLDAATDANALAELTARRSNVCVLAPFTRPREGAADVRWRDGTWEMSGDWRERLIRWAQARVPTPNKIDTDDILGWLAVIDPWGRLFRTPGDLLPLIARAYRSGLPTANAGLQGLSRETLSLTLGASSHEWLRHVGVVAVERLVEARLRCIDTGVGPLRLAEWARLLPANLTPMDAPPSAKTPKRSSKSAGPARVEQPAPLLAINMLADAAVLRACEGGFDVAEWIRVGVEREVIAHAVKAGDAEWPLWSVDAARQARVDDALDGMAPLDLVVAARKAVAADPTRLETVAAVETLFAAIGRRLVGGTWSPVPSMVGTLQALGQRQLQILGALPTDGTVMPFLPLTRQRLATDHAAQYEWLAGAWEFSIVVERPTTLNVDPWWWLPGWAPTLRLSEPPGQLPLPEAGNSIEGVACRRLLGVARHVVARCVDEALPNDVPHLLLPWVVIDAPKRRWAPTSGCEHLLMYGHGLGEIVGELLEHEPADVRLATVTTAWRAAAALSPGSPAFALRHLGERAPTLLNAIIAELPTEVFISTVALDSLMAGEVGHELRVVPPRFVRALLPAVLRRLRESKRSIHDLASIVGRLEPDDLDLLVELARDVTPTGSAAAARVWSLDPERALVEARAAMTRGEDMPSGLWFAAAPREHHGALLDVLDTPKATRLSWRSGWLTRVLPTAGSNARRVFDMMRSTPGHATL